MKPTSANPNNETLYKQAEAQEARQWQENVKKAQGAAERLFPEEKWKLVEDRIYLSLRRPIGEKSNYKDELRDAQILRDGGSAIYLTPEPRNEIGKKYDAIVNGLMMEFKNIHGSSVRTLRDHFLTSRGQAPNVFINLENSPLTRHQVMSTLYGAINCEDYGKKNKFEEGSIILKTQGQTNLLYLNIDDLKAPMEALINEG